MFQAQMKAPVPPSLKKESQVLVVNGIIMVSRAHYMCKPGLDPIDCKSSLTLFFSRQPSFLSYPNGQFS